MGNITVVLIILAVLSGATAKIISEKRKGTKCIGCPYGKAANGNCSCQISKDDIN